MPDPNAYTVGWICAVTKELVAAQALLDEKHAEPNHVPVNDNNSYTLGRIGEHYVVIAALPHWQYGIANAATVARDMVRSFPNVRIGLMVGIGGGVPTKHDIRLGDVVVSSPGYGNGGVFQYDYGIAMQDQRFSVTSSLNQPPIFCLTAMTKLVAEYEIQGHQLEETIQAVLERNPRLRKQYQRPDLSTDGLYEAEFVHASGGANCVTACDESRLIHRVARSADEDNPKVHYGLIASGNKLIKNAVVRDRLSAEKDVLCFEMEAAGLMNHFPCVVIRGICDYSDSHKNEEWQGYAAMVAAAYAKDLLCQIPPNKVEAERRIEEVLAGVVGTISKIGENFEAVRSNLDRNEDHKILNWLTPIDYGPQQSDNLRRWQPGTGQWLLQSKIFQDWLATSKQTLFCPGIPGAGKTILTSIVVDDLNSRFRNDSKTGIAYIYCDFRRHNEQKIDDLLASVLRQLAESQSSLPENVKDLYDRCKGKRTRPSLDEISRVLHSVAAIYSRVFIIVDALDECQVFDRCRSKFLSEVFSLQAETGANLLVTSRFIRDITAEFEGRSMSLTIRATGEDVLTYLAGQMDRLPSFVKSSPDLQNLIKATISKVVDGMFLLAPLHIDALAREPTVGDIESALQNLSRGTDEIYKQALIRIESQGGRFRDLAKKVLSWVVHAKRVLSTTELQHALAVKPGEPELNEKFIPSTDIIGSICAGLVTIDAKSDVVRLIHYTTQEYLEQTHNIWFPEAESAIATICVTYLSFSAFETGYCKTDDEFEERLRLNPVYDYAAHNWGHHARQALTLGQELGQEVIDFLRCLPKLEASSQVMMAPKQGSWNALFGQRFPTQMTGLHLAGYFGVCKAVDKLLRLKHNPNLEDSYGRTPLSWAAANGHESVVKLLLETGEVDADLKDDINGRTPLSWAAANGHEAVVKLLLETGEVDADSKDKYGRTPLLWAATNRHESVVKLLLETGEVDADSKDKYDQTPLSWATMIGHESVVKLLLETGEVDADSKDKYGQTPLSWAAENGHEAVVKLLLETGEVDADSKDKYDQTPLSRAATNKHESVVKLLLETGEVDADSKDKYSQTPLWRAVANGHESVVKLLLETGEVNVDLKDKYGRTLLSRAATNGHESVVKLLLSVRPKIRLLEDSEVAEKILTRRSKRIQTRSKNETLAILAKPQGIRRRGVRKKKRL